MKYLLIIVIFIGFSAFGQNTSGKIVYSKTLDYQKEFKKDKEQGKDQNKKMREMFTEIASATKGLEYALLFNEKESSFSIKDIMINDATPLQRRAISMGKGKGKFYNNIEADNVLYQRNLLGSDFLIIIPKEKYQWELTSDQKIIAGYPVRRATATYVVKAPNKNLKDITLHLEAWYAPTIPLPYGPIDLAGLPGLILETTLGNVTYRAESVEWNENSDHHISKPTEGTMIKEEDMPKIMKKMRERLVRD